MLFIDNYAYTNRLRSVHPAEKMFLACFLLIFTIAVKNTIISLITFVVMSSFTIFIAKIPLRSYVKLLLLPGFFLVPSVFMILLSITPAQGEATAFIWSAELGNWRMFITKHAAETVLSLLCTVFGSISCLYFLILTTPVPAIFHVLRCLHVPTWLLEIMEITYRFIFIFIECAQQIYLAQQARLGYGSLKRSFQSLALLITSIFAAVFQRAKELTIVMNSRNYQGEIHYFDEKYKFSLVNWGLIATIVIFMIIIYIYFWGPVS